MTEQLSRSVSSNQTGLHEHLEKVVSTHLKTHFERPIASHNIEAFDKAIMLAAGRPIIFDSGCGNGKSTQLIADQHPQAFVIGIDKSTYRLDKNNDFNDTSQPAAHNFHLTRADIIDFWRLASSNKITLHKHFILYPNPWPKKKHLHRRWHGSPVFPDLLALGGDLEVRSNWPTYIQEMQQALELAGFSSKVCRIELAKEHYISDFEQKYARSEQTLWQLNAHLGHPSGH